MSESSPIFGSRVELYQVIFEITRLSWFTPLSGERVGEAEGYDRKLDELRERPHSGSEQGSRG